MSDEMNLSHLTELLRMSKSLVFVPDRATAKIVRKTCHALGLPCLLSDEYLVSQIRIFERDKENFATICVISYMKTGWHSLAEQTIWIGPVNDVAQYMQAMARVNGKRPGHTLENWGRPS